MVAALACWLCAAAVSQTVPQLKDGLITGAGFTLKLPPGVSAQIGANSESEHGFYIDLQPHPEHVESRSAHVRSFRYIAFDTRWDIGDMPSLDAAAQVVTSGITDNLPSYIVSSGDILLDGNYPARLGTLPARRLVFKFRNSERKPSVRMVIVAYDARKDASAIVYLLTLNTTQENYDEDLGVFGKVLAGFKLSDH